MDKTKILKRDMLDIYLNELGEIPEFLKKYLSLPCLTRLKKVCYFCGMDYASKNIYDFIEDVSRFDHSLNVALLGWKLTHDKKVALAGLFHDIATPCFSHVIDYMNKDYASQESTEEKTEEILRGDKLLCELLKEDDIDISEIIDFKKYSVIDNDRPKLCSDRLDGVVLTGLYWTKNLKVNDVLDIIRDIDIFDNEFNEKEIGFKSESIASLVLKTSEMIDEYCHSNEDNYMMELLAKITRRAIELECITYDELYTMNEEEILNIFEESNDEEIKNDLKLFKEIKLEDVPVINLGEVKKRALNPLVRNRRLK